MSKLKSKFFRQEFEAAGFPLAPTPLELFLLKNLMQEVLDPLREGVGVPVYVNDCYRSYAKYIKMQGTYNPSSTSDHFWGQAIPTSNPKDQARFGPNFCFSVGAADIRISSKLDIELAFAKVMGLNLPLGQCILESNGSSKWLHVSNPRTLCFSPAVIAAVGIGKVTYLTSTDNGKTYQAVV